jgi:ribokinase
VGPKHKRKSRGDIVAADSAMVTTVVVGAINWDTTLFVDKFPRRGAEVVVRRISQLPGGKGGNAAVAAARLLGPNKVAIIGALGNDWVASEHTRIFKEEGVDCSGLKHNDSIQSGQAHIIVDKTGENVIHTYFGANATILPEDLDYANRRELIENASIVTIMDPPFRTSLKLAQSAKKLGKIVAWDPGVKSQLGYDTISSLLRNVDYFLANESEVGFLTGTKTQALAARKLQRANPNLKVIMKLGGRGSVMYRGRERIGSRGLDLKRTGLRVVNTVGCGDAFLGAFVASISEGRPDLEALKWGNFAAGLKATRPETRGSPDRATLMKYLV